MSIGNDRYSSNYRCAVLHGAFAFDALLNRFRFNIVKLRIAAFLPLLITIETMLVDGRQTHKTIIAHCIYKLHMVED